MDSIKKRKMNEVEGREGSITLGEAWANLKGGGPALYYSLDEYLKDEANGKDVTEMMTAQYYKSVGLENKFVVPTEFRSFTVSRNAKGEVTQILGADNQVLLGGTLTKVLAYDAMKKKGVGKLIMSAIPDSDNFEALAVPGMVQVEETPSDKSREYHEERRIVYTQKARTTIYASRKNIKEALSLDYVSLSEVTNILRALNAVESREDLRAFNVGLLADVASIQTAIRDDDVKQSKKNFYKTLLVSAISKLSIEERIAVFEGDTTYRLANELNFRLPHGGPVYDSLGNKEATRVTLGSLEPGDSVLMSTNVMSMSEYKSLRGDVLNYKVYKDSDSIGGRRNKTKWAKLSVKYVQSQNQVLRILTAIAGTNEPSKGSALSTAAIAPVASNLSSIDLI